MVYWRNLFVFLVIAMALFMGQILTDNINRVCLDVLSEWVNACLLANIGSPEESLLHNISRISLYFRLM